MGEAPRRRLRLSQGLKEGTDARHSAKVAMMWVFLGTMVLPTTTATCCLFPLPSVYGSIRLELLPEDENLIRSVSLASSTLQLWANFSSRANIFRLLHLMDKSMGA